MPNEQLIPIEQASLTKYSDDAFELAVRSGDYLPRVQLMIANSQPCQTAKFPVNHYALIKGQDYVDLGAELDVLIVTWRPKALEIGENVIAAYDPEDAEFKRIQEKSAESNSGCMFGPEFLIWIPKVKEIATLFMGSASSRREAKANLKPRLQKAATLKSHQIKTKKYTWFSPLVTACSTPITPMPDMELLQKQVDKFNNPPASEIEHVSEQEKQSASDRQR